MQLQTDAEMLFTLFAVRGNVVPRTKKTKGTMEHSHGTNKLRSRKNFRAVIIVKMNAYWSIYIPVYVFMQMLLEAF